VKRAFRILALLFYVTSPSLAQSNAKSAKDISFAFTVIVLNEKSQPADGATVQLLKNAKLAKVEITDAKGTVVFRDVAAGDYNISVTYTGYQPQTSGVYHVPGDANSTTITLQPETDSLKAVNVTAKRPFIEQKEGMVILNLDASITNVGTNVLEVLQKSPGVTVDRNGGISLQGKTGVLVTIDGRPTYLSGDDLNNLLSSMSSSQVDQIELIAIPTAKYDASGNAGIINIKTKRIKQKGFNGTFTTSVSQGAYPKNTENLLLNYRIGRFNTFLSYNSNYNQYYLNLYALRKYYSANDTVLSQLEQPSYFKGTALNHTIKTGVDYSLNSRTNLGIVLTGMSIARHGNNTDPARWLSPSGALDSTIFTNNLNKSNFKNGAINVNYRQAIAADQEITADFDYLHYAMSDNQNFQYQFLGPAGYDELSRANIPTTINIITGKIDYITKPVKNATLEAGWKSSHSSTDNSALYQNLVDSEYVDDDTKSNRFLYTETISALYGDYEQKLDRLTFKAGVRYELTTYHATQLGNAIQKDSAFSRNYGSLFPSGYFSYQIDSSNTLNLTAGRRIDRPAFQVLNPFIFIINKYTYETGNPYILPQYSWNLALSHQYKDLFTTTLTYSVISNYFSQLFLTDTAKEILLYSQGNVGHTYNFGISESVALSPVKWWSFTTEAVFNHKKLEGFNGNNYVSTINQLSVNITSQFTIAALCTAEITGNYTTRARNDIQELLYPTGQVSLGLSRPVLKNKGTLKLSFRDLFHTDWMEGLTQFPDATEYFKELSDTRVITLAFIYRFGKAFHAVKHTDTSADEEIQRVGDGQQ
jgi:iron complex outermembrane receptor protein